MAWTTPRTWTDGEIVTKAIMDTHVRDNLDYLKDRLDGAAKQYIRTATNYTTTSTSYVEVDGTGNLTLTFTTDGSDVRVTFVGYGSTATAKWIGMGVDVDGTEYELVRADSETTDGYVNLSFSYVFTGLSAASHTFKLIWRAEDSNTATLYAGTLLFDVREELGLIA